MDFKGFEERKQDHIRLALKPAHEAVGQNGLDSIQLIHEAIPELDFSHVQLNTKFWQYEAASPCFISSMTAGHHDGEQLNLRLAKVAQTKKWPMGLGSQRRELNDPNAKQEWKALRTHAPQAILFSNLGLTQLIETPLNNVLQLLENLQASAIIIHTNPLQEALQKEGTPHFSGGLKALEALIKKSPVPVIVKETGCGFAKVTIRRLANIGVAAIDVSGFGGTHWGRIEGERAGKESIQALAAETFANWGISTRDSLLHAKAVQQDYNVNFEVWASGGIRNGLEVAKCLALGATKVGFAKPALEAAYKSEDDLFHWMQKIEFELKIALFCTGCKNPEILREGNKWQKI